MCRYYTTARKIRTAPCGRFRYVGSMMPLSRASARAAVLLAVFVAASDAAVAQLPAPVASPDGRNVVTVSIDSGTLRYALRRGGANVLMPSALGFEFRNAPRLRDNLRLVNVARMTHDETWTQPWGEVRQVRDHHNELRVT